MLSKFGNLLEMQILGSTLDLLDQKLGCEAQPPVIDQAPQGNLLHAKVSKPLS